MNVHEHVLITRSPPRELGTHTRLQVWQSPFFKECGMNLSSFLQKSGEITGVGGKNMETLSQFCEGLNENIPFHIS